MLAPGLPDTITPPSQPDNPAANGVYEIGVASYYGRKFHGRETANGEIFDMHDFTAAHPDLPLGTVIKVTNMNNGRHVKVRVNDRGPFVAGRILDLSLGAATELHMVSRGTAPVIIEIVEAGDWYDQ